MPTMRVVNNVALLASLAAALIHVWFFAMESVWFMRPSVYRRFGLATEEHARIARSFAYNQGFYNLFLAAGVVIGLALAATGDPSGRTILLFSCGSMVAAGVVLVLHNRTLARAAAIQAVPPLIAIAGLLL